MVSHFYVFCKENKDIYRYMFNITFQEKAFKPADVQPGHFSITAG